MTNDLAPSPEAAHQPSPPPARSRSLALAAILLVVGVAGIAVAARGRSHPAEPAAPAALQVKGGALEISPSAPQWRYIEVGVAALGAALPAVPAPARVLVDEGRSAPIFAPLAGRVERVSVQLGQEIKPGDRLVAIRSSALPELGREVESARAALGVKTAMMERVRDLVGLRAVPEKDLILAEQERHETELSLKAAEGKRRSLRLSSLDDSGLYWVTAPRRGTVVDRRALVGMEVGPDRPEPLLTIADLGQVIVVADVLERETAGIELGGKASVTDVALGGQSIAGTVEYVAQLVDPVRRAVAVRVRVDNPDHRLRPNAFAQVNFAPRSERYVVVPSEAVVTDDQKSVVFVRHDLPGRPVRLERREVRVGRVREDRTEIVSGLAPGESYVSRGALLLLNALDLAG
jgi:cobalt-zinc-cadmium efflux system membrane fusion protein